MLKAVARFSSNLLHALQVSHLNRRDLIIQVNFEICQVGVYKAKLTPENMRSKSQSLIPGHAEKHSSFRL